MYNCGAISVGSRGCGRYFVFYFPLYRLRNLLGPDNNNSEHSYICMSVMWTLNMIIGTDIAPPPSLAAVLDTAHVTWPCSQCSNTQIQSLHLLNSSLISKSANHRRRLFVFTRVQVSPLHLSPTPFPLPPFINLLLAFSDAKRPFKSIYRLCEAL